MKCLLALLLLLAVVVVHPTYAAEAEAVPTEAEIRKFKMKDLKGFLSDRGLSCNNCHEKADFVAKCIESINVPVLDTKKMAKGVLWEVWAGLAFDMCSGAKATNADVCNAVKVAVDSMFMQHGRKAAQTLKKKPSDVLKTSLKDPYMAAGQRLLKKLIKGSLTGSVTSSTTIQATHEKAFKDWITNVGIENTNPMYDITKAKEKPGDEL